MPILNIETFTSSEIIIPQLLGPFATHEYKPTESEGCRSRIINVGELAPLMRVSSSTIKPFLNH